MAARDVTTLGWIVVVLWVVGGLPLGVACAVAEKRIDGDYNPGFVVLVAWLLAPFVASGIAFLVVTGLLGRVVDRADRAFPSRGQLQDRVEELERELDVR